jgi:hypothetical protein
MEFFLRLKSMKGLASEITNTFLGGDSRQALGKSKK